MTKANTKTKADAKNEDTDPYYFLIDKGNYAIGTPKGIGVTDRTRDYRFHDFAKNYDIQIALNLLSAVLIKPVWKPPLAYPLEGRELINCSAGFLAAFEEEPVERKKRYDYLTNNGLIRVLVTNNQLLEKLDEIQMKQDLSVLRNTLERYERSSLPSANLGYSPKDRVGTDFRTNQPIFRYRN